MKRILLIGTGGTIASINTSDGLAPQISLNEILNYLPEISSLCQIDTLQVCNIDSTNISVEIWIGLVETIKKNYDNYDGFIILHGTDTMAYTAAALSYMIQKSPKPIVITGAQRPINKDFTDAKPNLYDSFLYGCSDEARGVQIVFNGKIILGTRARKTHSKSLQAFSSINFPYLGIIQGDRIIQFIRQSKEPSPTFYTRLNSKIGIFKLIPTSNEELLDYMLSKNDAIIIESYGVGGIPSKPNYNYYDIIKKWNDKGKIIVMTTQVPNEGSNMTVYKVGHNLKKDINILEAYDMITEAVVCKLMWILGITKQAKEVENLFYTTIENDILYRI